VVLLFVLLLLLEHNDDRCGRCGNLAFFARFPNPCGRVLCVHRGGSVHIVFDVAGIIVAAAPVIASPRGIPQ
jgi:hypothetical protein